METLLSNDKYTVVVQPLKYICLLSLYLLTQSIVMYSLVSRKKFIGIKPLILVTDYVANTLVRQQIKTFVENQQLIAKQKFVFLKGIIDRGVVLRVNGKKFSPTGIQLNLTDTVYWQDMIELTGWKQVGGIDDYIHLSTLLPNCLYLQQLVEID